MAIIDRERDRVRPDRQLRCQHAAGAERLRPFTPDVGERIAIGIARAAALVRGSKRRHRCEAGEFDSCPFGTAFTIGASPSLSDLDYALAHSRKRGNAALFESLTIQDATTSLVRLRDVY